ncbi:MAG: LacI family transcriptional regulator [Kosmotogales bacterium]|nr:LacI family transcriptional regulator [Kosmotogales bacterium]
MKKGYVTIKTVAKELNISVSTVSRVINKKPDVSEETKKKVLTKIEELGYIRNVTATMMRNKMSKTIGVIFESEFDPFFSEILGGIEKGVSKYNYRMILMNTKLREEEGKTAINTLMEHRVDGIIIIPTDPNISYIQKLVEKKFPIVIIGRNYDKFDVDEIYTDDYFGGQIAAEYLFSKGKRKLLMINSSSENSASMSREKGFISKLSEMGLKCTVIKDKNSDYGEVFNIIRSLYFEKRCYPFDGIFCFNDMRAFAVINALRSVNNALLKEISVIGYDDILFSSIFSPKLTTIHIDKQKEGYEAVKLLTQKITGRRKFTKKKILKVSLVIRET